MKQDSDCKSGRCDLDMLVHKCYAQTENGDGCNENSDCKSGRCNGNVWVRKCHAQMENGENCNIETATVKVIIASNDIFG